MAPGLVTVLYTADTKFDMNYYLKNHMPLVHSSWKKYGLKSWKVIEYGEGSLYKVQAILEFEDESNWTQAAASTEKDTIMADIPNYSDKDCIIISGAVTGAAS
ncbi:hypothetical protein F4810DRAFT_204223 [Camillea tinctor]|nr:hypothetical protein F4810DRAFT_204223 [Camillea tinctor]